MCEIDTGNPKYTTITKLVQVRNFITFELKVIRHAERDTQSFYTDCFDICPKPRAVPHLQTTGLGGPRKSNYPFGRRNSTNCFFSIPNILSTSGHDVNHAHGPVSYLGFLLWHLWLLHPPSTRVNTCTQLTHELTNPCTKRKVLSLTKPKGKIYKSEKW